MGVKTQCGVINFPSHTHFLENCKDWDLKHECYFLSFALIIFKNY